MNSFLISVGAALVVALLAAFIGPAFVDWNAYRDRIEAEATRILCREVSIGGDLDVRLLPQPLISTGRMDISDTGGIALATVEAATMHLGLGELLVGGIEVIGLDLDRPRVALATGKDGAFNWGPAVAGGCEAELGRVTFRKASITDGVISFVDGLSGASLVLDHVDLNVIAGNLAGPYRITGQHGSVDTRLPFTISSGRVDTGAPTRVSGRIALDSATEATFDGTMRGWETPPHYSGKARIVRSLSVPGEPLSELRADALAEIGPGGGEISELSVMVTDGGDTTAATGRGRLFHENGAPRINLELASRRLDIGALAAEDSKAGAGMTSVLAGANAWLGDSSVIGRLSLTVDGAVYGGELVQDLEAVFNFGAENLGVETFSATLPGQSEFGFSGGLIGSQESGRLVGTLVLNTRDLRRLLQWSLPTGQQRLVDLVPANHGRLSITGGLAAEPNGVEMTGIEGLLDGDSFSGDISFGHGDGADSGGPGEVHVDLAFDDLDLDRLIDTDFDPLEFAAAGMTTDEADEPLPAIAVEFAAKRVRWRGREARGARLIGRLENADMTLERLEIDNLAGARITAKGAGDLTEEGAAGGLDYSIETTELTTLLETIGVDVTGRLGLGPAWSSLIGEAELTGKLESSENDGKWLVATELSGEVGGTRLDANISSDRPPGAIAKGRITAHARFGSDDIGRLAAQLDLVGTTASTPGEAGSLDLELAGTRENGFDYVVRAEGMTAELDVVGRIKAEPAGVEGDVTIDILDTARAARSIGVKNAGDRPVRTEISAGASFRNGVLQLREVSGRLSGNEIRGGIRYDLSGGEGATIGLQLDSLSMPWLLSALFAGAPGVVPTQSTSPGTTSEPGPWSTDLIDASVLEGIPIVARIDVDRLDLADGIRLKNARLEGQIGGGSLELRRLSGTIDRGGSFEAKGRFSESALSLLLEGEVVARGLPIGDLLVDGRGRPVVTGHGDIDVRVSAAGRSLLSLASSLAGEGVVEAATLDLPRVGAEAVMRRVGGARSEAALRGLLERAKRGATVLQIGSGNVTAADGRITFGPLPVSVGILTGEIKTFVNLTGRRIDQEIVLGSDPGPRLTIVHAGDVDNIVREIELSGLPSGEIRLVEPEGRGGSVGGEAIVPPDDASALSNNAVDGPPAGVIDERVFELPLSVGSD